MTTSIAGFWSYTHKDDDAEAGRILRLSRLIADQYGLITGEDLQLFVDKESLEWGQEWERWLREALLETKFLIPIITPRYLKSEACRSEILTFAGKAKSLGIEELVLPIIYVQPPEFDEPDAGSDEVVALVKKMQWQDWRLLRLEDENSSSHRTAVSKLAQRIAKIVDSVSRKPALTPPDEAQGTDDERPGFLDLMAAGEELLPRWANNLTELGDEFSAMTPLIEKTTNDLTASDRSGGGASGRLRVVHSFAQSLSPHAKRINSLGTEFATSAVDINSGILSMLQRIKDGDFQADEKQELGEFFSTLEVVGSQTREAVAMFDSFTESISGLPGLSRDLRPVVGDLTNGVRKFKDGLAVFDAWQAQIDEIRTSANWLAA